ncbi:MAG TPA: phosphosulfolactate synthase, partial [Candidatus Limnocylindrales bacterium]|nr:phosphosulfolactate synthase [Candidatus Limnocylindrales bacterium]
MTDDERAFSFIPLNPREGKPRTRGLTEIRGPYYSVMGSRYLSDLLETVGDWVDSLKFAGGSFTLMPKSAVRSIIDTAHAHQVQVSTGGFIEHVLSLGPAIVDRYIDECGQMGFDIVEISSGFLSMPADDMVRLTKKVLEKGLKPKPEVGIQFGAGGTSTVTELATEGT